MPWMARLGFVSILVFVASLVTLHLANPQPPEHLSGFVHTPLAWLWILSLCAFALGGVALTLELRKRLVTNPFRGAGITMLWLSCAGALVLAAFPVDADPYNRTTLGLIHEDAGPPTFLLAAAAMLVLAPAFYSARGWRPFAALSLVCGLLATAFALSYVFATLAGDEMAGVLQRILIGCIIAWMFLVSLRLLRRPEPAAEDKRKDALPRPTCAI